MSKTQDRLAAVKRRLANKEKQKSTPIDPKVKLALEIGFAYERALGIYLHKPTLRFFTNLGEEGIKPQTLSFLKKAAEIIVDQNVNIETFIASQFYWFHEWFRRPPKVRELVSTNPKQKNNALWRLREYCKLVEAEAYVGTYTKVMPSGKVSAEDLDKINKQRLKELVEAWDKSEEAIIQLFAGAEVFDQQWLEKQEVYQQLKQSGKLDGEKG